MHQYVVSQNVVMLQSSQAVLDMARAIGKVNQKTVHLDLLGLDKIPDVEARMGQPLSQSEKITSLQLQVAEQFVQSRGNRNTVDPLMAFIKNTYHGGTAQIERVFGGRYRIYLRLKTDASLTLNALKKHLENPYYQLYLGQSNDAAVIENINIHQATKKTIHGSDIKININTWAPLEQGEGIMSTKLPVSMYHKTDAKGERKLKDDPVIVYKNYALGLSSALPGEKVDITGGDYYHIKHDQKSVNITF